MSIANNTVNLSEIMTTASDGEGVLGKIVFYGLGGIMIDREEFERLRAACQFSAPTNFRSTPADAFRSATGDLHDRLVRGTQIYKVYCRDNRQRRHTISRELVLEEVDSTTNMYTKLANIVLDKESEIITLEDVAYNPIVDSQPYFDQVQESFQLYRRCVNRRQMDTVLGKMLDDNRYCGDILTQVAAVESALQAFGYQILQKHMETCVVEEIQKGHTDIVDEAVELIKKLK